MRRSPFTPGILVTVIVIVIPSFAGSDEEQINRITQKRSIDFIQKIRREGQVGAPKSSEDFRENRFFCGEWYLRKFLHYPVIYCRFSLIHW